MDKEIIFKAFKAGEQWGVTYSTWFTPLEGEDRKDFEKWYETLTKTEPKLNLLERCTAHMKNGLSLTALKLYKDETGCSLTEAKQALNIGQTLH